MYYDRKGEKIDVLRFGQLFEDISYRIIKTSSYEGYSIFTVWLGFDHDFTNLCLIKPNPPKIFETAIIKDGSIDVKTFLTELEALHYHDVAYTNIVDFNKQEEKPIKKSKIVDFNKQEEKPIKKSKK